MRLPRFRAPFMLVAACVVVQGCNWIQGVIGTGPNFNLPECPQYGEWSKFLAGKHQEFVVAASGQLSLPGRITDVPEFHDCQKFIVQGTGAKPSYLPLYAIFARDSLREVTAYIDTVADSTGATGHATPSGTAIAVGEILALQQDYPQLGIKPLFNCLFLTPTTSGLQAKMVPVNGAEQKCKTITHPEDEAGTVLQVRRTFFKYDTVPPVARWDWDSTAQQQHLGIACGTAWCDVGANGFHPSAAHATSSGSPTDRVLAVKGFYDEQRLAVPSTSGTPFGVPGGLVVGPVVGTFVPMPDLGSDGGPEAGSRYDTHWVQVATAGMPDANVDYLNKLHFLKSDVRHPVDSVSLCYGLTGQCLPAGAKPKCTVGTAKQWWARVTNGSAKTAYFCVTRRGHESIPGLHIPGIVRWRWALKDETMWIRCLEGCCEVEAGTKDVM